MVDNALFEKTHTKITALYFIPCVGWSWIVACNLLHEIGNAGKGLNNVPCVVWSWIVACNLLHEIVNIRKG